SLNGKPLFSLTNWDPVQCTTTPSFTPGTTICNVGINPLGTAPYRTGWGNIAPRGGAAYQLSPDPKWGSVLRAGFGVFYDTASNAASSTLGPFSPATTGPTGGPGTPCSGFFVQFPVIDPGCLTPPPAHTSARPSMAGLVQGGLDSTTHRSVRGSAPPRLRPQPLGVKKEP